ncbi:MAG: hypothetical protein HYX85_01850 [Chloroflexi bacterium]|nr:hypothetical protein [Chloroflexota bacterium]
MALFLRRKGYRAFALKGGYRAWEEAGYPTEARKATASVNPDRAAGK